MEVKPGSRVKRSRPVGTTAATATHFRGMEGSRGLAIPTTAAAPVPPPDNSLKCAICLDKMEVMAAPPCGWVEKDLDGQDCLGLNAFVSDQ